VIQARDAASPEAVPSITVGVVGQPCRAEVSPWGDVTPWGSRTAPVGTLRWLVAAEDRWHDPSVEAAVRQHRIAGTPVVETRLRIPDGDAVQYAWSTPDRGGVTVVEIYNDSPLSFAVAFAGLAVLTDRPPADVPVQGIDLPADAFVMPVGHHASVRVAIPHEPERWAGRTPSEIRADRASVVAGWTATVERASRLDLPDDVLVTDVIEARCDLLLSGPIEATDDAVGFMLDVAELVRLGESADAWLPEIVAPVESLGRADGTDVDAALVAAERIAIAADDHRAAGDISRLRARRHPAGGAALGPFSEMVRGRSAGRFVSEVERRLANGGDLLPAGVPTPWLGVGFEVHRVPTTARSTVSFAIRWHGERPAVLWEQRGETIPLTASAVDPMWATVDASGEALWAAPARPRQISVLEEAMGPSGFRDEGSPEKEK
jgi:hypothetical protein